MNRIDPVCVSLIVIAKAPVAGRAKTRLIPDLGADGAAAIAARHPEWDERPVLIAVRRPGSAVSEQEILDHFTGKVARWQEPDAVVFVDQLPLGGTGKVLKTKLREDYGGILL